MKIALKALRKLTRRELNAEGANKEVKKITLERDGVIL